MLKLNHKNLEVYKSGLIFIKEIYLLTGNFPDHEQYGLISQIRRASVSFLSNIAEGSARKSSAERKRFFEISRASLVEIDTQLEISLELDMIKKTDMKNVEELMTSLFYMISALIDKTN